MDYLQLSDFEINKRVAQLHGGFALTLAVHDEPPSGKRFDPGRFDPCNNPADAWPIIEGKLICLAADVFAEPHDGGKWVAQPAYGWEKERVRSDNPLRAAMIVFLMMQDAKHA